ncbi:putative nuclease HARBI1 [Centruroides sculpturatus]|uniref:putative nuclease HARBI1 n=1 Tax=Centruroides sculpturatus TaxID=218467 RepID=UPI000C6EB7E9|nr:putative nuclease HARBI1 [Centruroides sculpturatus]
MSAGVKTPSAPPKPYPTRSGFGLAWRQKNDQSGSVADRFNISKSTLYSYLNKVCTELVKMASDVIKWPKLEEYAYLTRKFKNIACFPGIIGAIDGCHIPIKAPSEAAEKYVNWKNFHSVILQAVCNHNLVFTDCYYGFPDSVHDARVFRNSEVIQKLNDSSLSDYHIVGDATYPLVVSLMVPFKNNGHLTAQMHTYNNKLSKSRIVIERSFALLKGRFRWLKNFDANKTSMLTLYILSACVLHNICLMAGDDFDEFDS